MLHVLTLYLLIEVDVILDDGPIETCSPPHVVLVPSRIVLLVEVVATKQEQSVCTAVRETKSLCLFNVPMDTHDSQTPNEKKVNESLPMPMPMPISAKDGCQCCHCKRKGKNKSQS